MTRQEFPAHAGMNRPAARSTSLVAKDYLITHSPGLSWTGTNYWATDAIRCRAKICEEVAVLTTGICEVTQLANERIESQPDGPPSIAKAEAWIRFYRTLMTPQSDESHEPPTRL